jgi:ABC-type spermidine/putrescine transport system permease subunit II
MMDVIFRVGLSNSCLAVVLATAAMLVGANAKRASLAHILWLMVLLKLVTPPIVNVSSPYSWQSETSLVDEQPRLLEESTTVPCWLWQLPVLSTMRW